MKVRQNLNFNYDVWAVNQLKDEKRKTDLLFKAKKMAELIPEKLYFKNAVEIGCAEGTVINRLRDLLHIEKCYGIDVSDIFLSKGRTLYPEIEFIKASGLKIPFADKSVDLIILSDIIEHIEELKLFMKEIKRVGKVVLLKVPLDKYLWRKLISEPLGRSPSVSMEHPDGHLHEFSKNSCKKMLKNMGCRILASNIYYNYETIENNYRKKNFILKIRWFLDKKIKQLFPKFAHTIFGGNFVVFFETGK